MTDRMTPRQRSRCMAAIKSRDTRPELAVRKFLFAQGMRFRVNNRRLPGSPDIVLPRYKTAIFVDGCFWHGHEGCRHAAMPKTNTRFWHDKITLNRARDYKVNIELRRMGWRVMRIWECEIDEASLQLLYQRIIGTPGVSSAGYAVAADTTSTLAAEPPETYGLPY